MNEAFKKWFWSLNADQQRELNIGVAFRAGMLAAAEICEKAEEWSDGARFAEDIREAARS